MKPWGVWGWMRRVHGVGLQPKMIEIEGEMAKGEWALACVGHVLLQNTHSLSHSHTHTHTSVGGALS